MNCRRLKLVRVDEIIWRPAENRLVIALNRFDWEAAVGETPAWQRRRAALRFDRVLSLRARNVGPRDKSKVLNLLARLRREQRQSFVLVSHDLHVVAHMCDAVAFMVDGRFTDVLARGQLRGARLRHPQAQRLLEAALAH